MKSIIFYMAAAVVLSTACDKDKDIPKMTMTTQKVGDLTISLAGSGKVTIDWGDGSKKEAYTLSEYFTTWLSEHKYSHTYLKGSDRTITITGDNITHLNCYDIGLTSLEVGKNVALTYLSCSNNQIKNLDVSGNKELQLLTCAFNQLTSLDVNRNNKLTQLTVWENKLTKLDVSNNPNLNYLNCSVNEIESLDISKNTELEQLFCGTNQLTSLDASKNKKLKSLWCDDNQLNSLNVKGLANLATLQCGKYVYLLERHNRLTSLDVSGCSSLNYLNCEENLLSVDALNALFETLNDNMAGAGKIISIRKNPGATDCDISKAENKGWQFINL